MRIKKEEALMEPVLVFAGELLREGEGEGANHPREVGEPNVALEEPREDAAFAGHASLSP